MSLFPLAALVKEPRFIPPHRLTASLSATDINGFATGEYAGWSGEDEIEEGTATVTAGKKMFVGPGGGRRRRGKSHGKFRASWTFSSPFSLSFSCALLFAPFIEHARIRALRFK